MKVMIDKHIYDGKKEIVMIILTDEDKTNIRNMDKDCNIYCEYPDEANTNKVVELMNEFKKGQVFS